MPFQKSNGDFRTEFLEFSTPQTLTRKSGCAQCLADRIAVDIRCITVNSKYREIATNLCLGGGGEGQ